MQSLKRKRIISKSKEPVATIPLLTSMDALPFLSISCSRTTTATCLGYAENDNSGASQSLLTIPANVPCYPGARFLASSNTWSGRFANGTPIPREQILGYRSEPSKTNFFKNSGTPATNTSSLAVRKYVLWVEGTGSVTVVPTTAIVVGAGIATAGNPVYFEVLTTGNVQFTVLGTVTFAQCEQYATITSKIFSGGTSTTRSADYLTVTLNNKLSVLQPYTIAADVQFFDYDTQVFNSPFLTSDKSFAPYFRVDKAVSQAIFRSDATHTGDDATIAVSNVLNVNKFVGRFTRNESTIFCNGIKGGSTIIGTLIDNPTVLYLGAQTASFTGYIKNVRIWQRALSDLEILKL